MGEITTSVLYDWKFTHIRDLHTQIVLAYLTQRYLLTRDPRPYCDDCLVPLIMRHLLVECPSFTDLLHHYLYLCRGRDSGVYYLSKVLGPACLSPGHDVFKYLEEAGLLPNL
ncbi:hypothetical protein E2C01_067112 [Portunus trituberculatus]|uniref:Uncharacterized protein n=1 Tax=Portunus trituberculatus TaxID=210409 RepID=A0A5B7HSQ8_PORTR|nr:hypothetical protein [Portunus trituberculatus]